MLRGWNAASYVAEVIVAKCSPCFIIGATCSYLHNQYFVYVSALKRTGWSRRVGSLLPVFLVNREDDCALVAWFNFCRRNDLADHGIK